MKISNIQVKNFKSFIDLSIDLNNFNVLIGACSSGKTNFIEIFKFLKDISINLNKAILKQGGPYFMKNFNSENNDLCLDISFKIDEDDYILPLPSKKIVIKFNKIDYHLSIKFGVDNYIIPKEIVKFDCCIYKFDDVNVEKNINSSNLISENILYLDNVDSNVEVRLEKPIKNISSEDIIPSSIVEIVNNYQEKDIPFALINSQLNSYPIPWNSIFEKMSFYDFDSKLCKVSDKDKTTILSEFGVFLPNILKNILNNDEKKRAFLNLLNNILPYVEDLNVKEYNGMNVFKIKETYSEKLVPSVSISDGTAVTIALIVALFFEKNEFIFIEEPERNIHPALLSKIITMMYESSLNKQIIITTHNPEILKHVRLEDVYYISRKYNNGSTMYKLINNKSIKPFIDELGIDEVFVDNYLEMYDV